MTVPATDFTYRQLAVIDRMAEISSADIMALEKLGIKVVQVTGDPHRVFSPIMVLQAVPKE